MSWSVTLMNFLYVDGVNGVWMYLNLKSRICRLYTSCRVSKIALYILATSLTNLAIPCIMQGHWKQFEEFLFDCQVSDPATLLFVSFVALETPCNGTAQERGSRLKLRHDSSMTSIDRFIVKEILQLLHTRYLTSKSLCVWSWYMQIFTSSSISLSLSAVESSARRTNFALKCPLDLVMFHLPLIERISKLLGIPG